MMNRCFLRFACREEAHAEDPDWKHCESFHPFSYQEAIDMLEKQMKTNATAHGGGYALCAGDIGDVADPPGATILEDDGFCCNKGNNMRWEGEDEAREALSYFRTMHEKEQRDVGDKLFVFSSDEKIAAADRGLVPLLFPNLLPGMTDDEFWDSNGWSALIHPIDDVCTIYSPRSTFARSTPPPRGYVVSICDSCVFEYVFCTSYVACLQVLGRLLPGLKAIEEAENCERILH